MESTAAARIDITKVAAAAAITSHLPAANNVKAIISDTDIILTPLLHTTDYLGLFATKWNKNLI